MKYWLLTKAPEVRRRMLLGIIFLVPLAFHRSTLDQMNVPKLTVLIIGVSLVAALRVIELIQGTDGSDLRRLWIPGGAMATALTVTWLLSPYRGWALFGAYERLQGLIPYLVIITLGVLVADAFGGRVAPVAWTLVASAALVGAYGVLQVLRLDPITWTRPGVAVSTVANPNFTGGFLGICLPVALALWFSEPARRKLVLALALPLVAGLIVTFSQGGWAAGLAGSAIVAGAHFRSRIKHARVLALALATVIALAAAGQVGLGVIDRDSRLVPPTVLLRSEAWVGGIRMGVDKLPFGSGPNSYAIEGPQYRMPVDALRINYNYPDDPHNVFLALLSGAGILGALAFLVVAGFTLVTALRWPDAPVLAVGFLGAVFAYFVQSLVSVDEITLRVALWVTLGCWVAARAPVPEPAAVGSKAARRRKARTRREPLRAPFAVAAVAILGVWGALWGLGFAVADAQAWHGMQLIGRGSPPQGAAELARASDFRDDFEYRRQYSLLLGQASLRMADEQRELGEQLFESAVSRYDHLDDFPHILRIVESARVLDAGSTFDPTFNERSLDAYERISRLDPYNPLIAMEMSAVLVELGRTDEALEAIEPFEEVVPERYREFWGGVALVHAAAGEATEAERAIELALAIDPRDRRALLAQELLDS